jgi:hypothetical protein
MNILMKWLPQALWHRRVTQFLGINQRATQPTRVLVAARHYLGLDTCGERVCVCKMGTLGRR